MTKIKKVSMRIPAQLHERLVIEADNDNRSLHAEIIEILESYFDSHRLRFRASELDRTVVTESETK